MSGGGTRTAPSLNLSQWWCQYWKKVSSLLSHKQTSTGILRALRSLLMSISCFLENFFTKRFTIVLYIEVLSTEASVYSNGLNLDIILLKCENRHIQSTTTLPKLKMKTCLNRWLDGFMLRPYAIAAAVGSLIIRITLRPAITPASILAWRCELLK
jgi:hypothetical protein